MFDLDGYKEPFYGVVTGRFNGSTLIQPDKSISPTAIFKNIRKAGSK